VTVAPELGPRIGRKPTAARFLRRLASTRKTRFSEIVYASKRVEMGFVVPPVPETIAIEALHPCEASGGTDLGAELARWPDSQAADGIR